MNTDQEIIFKSSTKQQQTNAVMKRPLFYKTVRTYNKKHQNRCDVDLHWLLNYYSCGLDDRTLKYWEVICNDCKFVDTRYNKLIIKKRLLFKKIKPTLLGFLKRRQNVYKEAKRILCTTFDDNVLDIFLQYCTAIVD